MNVEVGEFAHIYEVIWCEALQVGNTLVRYKCSYSHAKGGVMLITLGKIKRSVEPLNLLPKLICVDDFMQNIYLYCMRK